MNQKTFSLIAGTIFLLVAIMHALRLLFGWQVQINGVPIPYSFSWLGVTIALALAFFGLGLSRTHLKNNLWPISVFFGCKIRKIPRNSTNIPRRFSNFSLEISSKLSQSYF